MCKRMTILALTVIVGLALLGANAPAYADPPDRVGRLSYTEGVVSLHGADQDQWSPATLNFPVTTGYSFWTEPNSRAEIEVGAAEIRLDQTSQVDILQLDYATTQIQVAQGIVNVHMRQDVPAGVQIQTTAGTVNLTKAGSYRVDAGHPNGDAPADQVQVTVLEGEAQIVGPRSTLNVLPGETAIVTGNPVTFSLVEGNATPFDDWSLSREHRYVPSKTVNFVSQQTTGYQDLDGNGEWDTTPDYGPVWYPTAVPVDWAPYRYGHWAYVLPWGWTWIDDAPWGFAPFHYGRWAHIGNRWGWSPGVIVARPVYAPALVAFIGGAGWGISISIGDERPAIGWVPLAPREVFHPYYQASPTYVRNVNITNVTNVTNITNVTNVTVDNFANQQAATVVPSRAFTGAAPVERARVSIPRAELAQARVTPNVEHLRPTAASRVGIARPAVAEAVVPKPGVEAKIVNHPVTESTTRGPEATGAGAGNAGAAAAPEVPKAPGPRIRGNAGNRNAGKPGAGPQPITQEPAAAEPATGQKNAPAPGPASAPPHEATGGAGRNAGAVTAPEVQKAPGPPIRGKAGNRNAGKPGAGPQPIPQEPAAAEPATGPENAPAPGPTSAPVHTESRTKLQPGAASVSPPVKEQVDVSKVPAGRPIANITHPAQTTQITPTPQGWTRQPRGANKNVQKGAKEPQNPAKGNAPQPQGQPDNNAPQLQDQPGNNKNQRNN